MSLYSPIFTRKSCRKFHMASVETVALQEIDTVVGQTSPLLPEVKLTHKILGRTRLWAWELPKRCII